MNSQIQRARDYYQKAKEGIPMLAPDARFAVQVRTHIDTYISKNMENMCINALIHIDTHKETYTLASKQN